MVATVYGGGAKFRMLIAEVTQQGQRLSVRGPGIDVFYEVEGMDLPPVDASFAIWHLLWLAARRKEGRLHIAGSVDPVVLERANQMSRTWELWQPARWWPVTVTADQLSAPAQGAGGPLTLFSGGVDSTDMLMSLGRQETRGTALTIHGMDYPLSAPDQFSELLASTGELLGELNYRSVVLRTSARSICQGDLAWGMALAGCAFVFSTAFSKAQVAADLSWEQDAVSFPWGINHITNRYFGGTSFSLDYVGEHRTRTTKVRDIARSDLALRSISLCNNMQAARPRNCGRCQKCLRTKASFAVVLGYQPDIFADASFGPEEIARLNLSDKFEKAFFVDLYQYARHNGTLKALPWLEQRYVRDILEPARRKAYLKRLFKIRG